MGGLGGGVDNTYCGGCGWGWRDCGGREDALSTYAGAPMCGAGWADGWMLGGEMFGSTCDGASECWRDRGGAGVVCVPVACWEAATGGWHMC